MFATRLLVFWYCSIPPDTVGNVPFCRSMTPLWSADFRSRRRWDGAAECHLLYSDCLLLLSDCLLLFFDCLLLMFDDLLRLESSSFSSRVPVDEATVHFAWYQNTDKGKKKYYLLRLPQRLKLTNINKYPFIHTHQVTVHPCDGFKNVLNTFKFTQNISTKNGKKGQIKNAKTSKYTLK